MERSFHHQAMAIYSMIHKRVFAALRVHGLTIGQPKVLEYLAEHNGASNKEIARACFIEPASLSSVLDRMEKQGLVTRCVPEEDRRTVRIALTDEGAWLAAQVGIEFAQIESTAFRGISAREREQFFTTYRKIRENLADS